MHILETRTTTINKTKMKTLPKYMITLVLSLTVYFGAIASTPPGGCNFEWGMPQNAPLRDRNRPTNVLALPGAVFKVQYDKKNCGCGWPTVDVGAIGVKNGYPATSVTVKLKGYSCDGTANVASYYAHNVGPGQWDGGSGNAHTLKDANFITVLRVEIEYYDTEFGATYRYVTDYETGLDETYINNRPWREIQREAEEKKQEEEKARRAADEAQRRQQQAERQRQQEAAQQAEQARRQQAAQERREEQERQREEAAQRQALRDQLLQQQQQLQQQTNQDIQSDIQQAADALTQGINSILAEEQRKDDARAEQQRQQAEEAEQREAARQQAQQQAATDNSTNNNTYNSSANTNQTHYVSQDEYDRQRHQSTAEQIADLTDKGVDLYVKGDYMAGAGYLRQAYDLGDRCRAAYFLGWCYLQMNQGQQGINYLATVTCQRDGYDINAASNIGATYHFGQHGMQRDDAQAIVYFQKAVSLGGVTAQMMMGDIYRNGGNNVPKDLDRAVVQYSAAADAGAREAMNTLGELCLGRNDYKSALDWFKKGGTIQYALKDIQHTYLLPSPAAIRHIGEIAENGWGVPIDLNTAYLEYFDALQYVQWAAKGVVAFDDKGQVSGSCTIGYEDLESKLHKDLDRVFPKLTAVKAADIAGTWSYQLFWPSSTLSGVNGKITFTAGQEGSVTGSLVSDPGQRLTMNSTLACDGISKICINGTVQSPGSDITQLYNLVIMNSKSMLGIVQNIVPEGSGRPPFWDIPAYIIISR